MHHLSILPVLLALVSASTVVGQEKEAARVHADPRAKGRVHLVRDPGGHAATPQHLLFTPDAKKLISAGEDWTVQVWDVQTRERLRVFRLPQRVRGSREAQAPRANDPSRFASLNWEGRSIRQSTMPLVIDRKGKRVSFCTEVNDGKGKRVLTTFVCSLDTGETQTLKGVGPRDFSGDGQFLAMGAGGDVRLVEIATDKERRTAKILPANAKNVVTHLAFSPDGKTLAVVAEDANIYLLDADTLKPKNTWAVAGRDKVASVTWADDQILVCRSSSAEKTLIIVDAGTGELKYSYAAAELQSQLKRQVRKAKNLDVDEVKAITGQKQAFVRVHGNDNDDLGITGSFLLDWATGEASKMYFLGSDYWTSASAVAPDLSVAAHGDGGQQNAIILWNPKTGKVLEDGKTDFRLKPTARGARGHDDSIRWRPDGKGVVWVQLGSRYRAKWSYAELDLNNLAFRPITKDEFENYGRENAVRTLGDKLDKKWDKSIYERGIVREWDSLTLRGIEGGLAVRGRAKPVRLRLPVRQDWDFTFVAGGRVVGDRFGKNVLYVFNSATGEVLHSPYIVHSKIHALAVSPQPACRYVLVGSADQTLTVYNPTTLKVLLTVFPSGADWIAWTPEGYYAGTPGGERLMGWHVDNGPDQLASFYPADRFRKTFYRPDVIKLVLEKGSVEDALQAANVALKKDDVAVNKGVAKMAKLLPPTVTLSVADKQLPAVRLKVRAKAEAAEQPITSLRLFVDGRPFPDKKASKSFDGGVPKDEREWVVELPPGKHRLRVLASSTDASSRSNEVEIDCRPAKEKPVLHVLAIGIDEYQDKGLNLSCAANDATLLATTFKGQCKGLFGKVRPMVLLNKEATRAAVLATLEQLRTAPKTRVKDGDLMIVFFAGHGAKEKDQFYLLTHDTKVDDLARTALAGNKLRDALKEIPCQVLLMMDACHAGAFGSKGKLSKKNLRPATDQATRMLTDDEVGVAVMCAAMGNETAAERNSHGLFTKFVVEALTATKEVPFNKSNHRQYIHHLQSYVFDKVSEESQERQHPFLHLPWVVESFALRDVTAK